MKKNILFLFALISIFSLSALSQGDITADQNPNYQASRDKYMKLADSLTDWHSTTFQETYKAIDWLADRREARQERQEFRRQLRMERARWNNSYVGRYYYPYYRNSGYNYNNGWNQRRGGFYLNPWNAGYWWR